MAEAGRDSVGQACGTTAAAGVLAGEADAAQGVALAREGPVLVGRALAVGWRSLAWEGTDLEPRRTEVAGSLAGGGNLAAVGSLAVADNPAVGDNLHTLAAVGGSLHSLVVAGTLVAGDNRGSPEEDLRGKT